MTLDLADRRLVVLGDDDVLGSYPIADVQVTRRGSDRFDLRIGDEQLVFTADDAIRFSYEAMPVIESTDRDVPSQVLTKVKAWLRERIEPDDAPATGAATLRVDPDPDRDPDPDPAPDSDPEPVPEPVRRNPDFSPERPSSTSLSELRKRFGTQSLETVGNGTEALQFEEVDLVEERIEADPAPTLPREDAVKVEDEVEPAAAKPQPSESIAGETCKGLRGDGTPCGSAVVSDRGFCFAHDPQRVAERRLVQEQTTEAARRVRKSGSDMGDVLERLEQAVVEVHEGRLDPQQALAMASLAQAMIDTIELSQQSEKPRPG